MIMHWNPTTGADQQEYDRRVLEKAVLKLTDLREQERDGSLGQIGVLYLGLVNLRILWLKKQYRLRYGQRYN